MSAHPSYSHYYLLCPSTLFFFFCTSYSFLHILLFCTFFYFIAHFTLISLFLTICMPLCYVTLYNLYPYYFALSTERTWFDYISLLIIPCITYYVTNKETLNLEHTHSNTHTHTHTQTNTHTHTHTNTHTHTPIPTHTHTHTHTHHTHTNTHTHTHTNTHTNTHTHTLRNDPWLSHRWRVQQNPVSDTVCVCEEPLQRPLGPPRRRWPTACCPLEARRTETHTWPTDCCPLEARRPETHIWPTDCCPLEARRTETHIWPTHCCPLEVRRTETPHLTNSLLPSRGEETGDATSDQQTAAL